jgi:hypothetical protein
MKRVILLPLAVFLIVGFTPIAFSAEDEDHTKLLERERQKFDKEGDPVARVKIGIKISDLLLDDVAEALKEGNYDDMQRELTAYAETIQSAHDSLVGSGRDAAKKSGGFKELEIALRKHVRKFEDFARMLNIQGRLPLEKARDFAVGIREKLLKALFP